jgi:DNA-binding response OmpR family regulator
MSVGDVILDKGANRVMRDHVPVELSPKEYALFVVLLENRGKVLDREFLYTSVW